MAKTQVTFLDDNVLEAAKKRIRWCYENYDHVVLSFSGGKDSLCCFWLMREVMDDMGMQDVRTKAFFKDEEIIPDTVIDFVREFCEDPALTARFDVAYHAHTMASHMFIMGEHIPYTAWDENREWLRQPPPYAVRQIHPENTPMDQHYMNGFTVASMGLRGQVCIINGIRADESLTRYRSCTLKKGPFNWVMGSPGGEKNVKFNKPIFDWATGDLFKYFKERGIRYPSIYDVQLYSGESLRVATPLHDRAHATLVKLRVTFPRFYEQILDLWPEVATHEKYYGAVDRFGIIESYPKSWEGIVQYVNEQIDNPTSRAMALKQIRGVRTMKEKNRRLGRYSVGECYGFPLLHVFKQIVEGKYMKGIQSDPFPTGYTLEYEQASKALRNDTQEKG